MPKPRLEYKREYRSKNADKIREYQKLWEQKRMLDPAYKEQRRARQNLYNRSPKGKACRKRYRDRLRLKVIRKLGGKCSNPNCLVPGQIGDVCK